MVKSKRLPDELEIRLREDFKPLREKLKEMEEFVEKNLIELPNENIDDMDIGALDDAANELLDLYRSFLDELLTIAGSIKMINNKGSEYMEELERFPEKLDRLIWNINELKGALKNPTLDSPNLNAIERDLIDNINRLILETRQFISEYIYTALDAIFRDLKTMETYYE
ncbi:MAG: hypothetical protein ACP6IP_01870 [Candidatus Njordarchaeia archaeon]